MADEGQFAELVRHVHAVADDELVGAIEALEVRLDVGGEVAGLVEQNAAHHLARAPGGEQVVAWGAVFANAPFSEVFVPLHPDPDLADGDLATALRLLVDHGETVALEAIAEAPPAEGRMLSTELVDGTPRVPELITEMGFARDRAEYEMAISLDGEVPEPAWPDGITIAPMRGPCRCVTIGTWPCLSLLPAAPPAPSSASGSRLR